MYAEHKGLSITKDFINELFIYDGKELYWKHRAPKRRLDRPAGNVNKIIGYRQIRIYGRLFYAHRLIWTLVNGNIESGLVVDHKNGNRSDNSIGNLRVITASQNAINVKAKRNSKCGLRGISWDSANKKWRSAISLRGRTYRLGRFVCPVVAFLAYKKKSLELHGNLSRINSVL